ncbi:MAG: hypothetical protein CL928_05325 [Deltaproteobacteria bacterium]|nr:hypothetical protein [Deltaproteobacteria bacterium]
MRFLITALAFPIALITVLAGCSLEPNEDPEPEAEPSFCEQHGWTERPFNREGPYGEFRHSLAESFKVELHDGSEWKLRDHWSGCETVAIVTNRMRVSALDSSSTWESTEDLAALVAGSPRNAYYLFITASSSASAQAHQDDMQARIEEVLDDLDDEDRAWWEPRLLVVAEFVDDLDNWVERVLDDDAGTGFLIDRLQQIRLYGNFADVTRYDPALANADAWPWRANLAYVTHEVRASNFRSDRQDRLDAQQDVTIVTAWEQEVLQGNTDTEVVFPDAGVMGEFDTLEIDLTMDCPDPEQGESGHCGAWDYLSYIYLLEEGDAGEEDDTWMEMARFITTYHREGRYVVDATPMLVYLAQGGARTIRFDASSQSYLTTIDFRFRNADKGYAPSDATYLWGGRNFNEAYNTDREAITVDIPADASRVEVRALITGHGMADGNCAEFCNHQHEFTVGGETWLKDHPAIGNDTGCIDEIENGMTPNQGGTWWYGRGGWCPGQQVEPTIFDVTAAVEPGGSAEVSYRGLLGGNTPPPNSGNIRMSSWLVVYR